MSSREYDAAVQYLIWALEEIEKFGSQVASLHARNALKELRTLQKKAEEAEISN